DSTRLLVKIALFGAGHRYRHCHRPYSRERVAASAPEYWRARGCDSRSSFPWALSLVGGRWRSASENARHSRGCFPERSALAGAMVLGNYCCVCFCGNDSRGNRAPVPFRALSGWGVSPWLRLVIHSLVAFEVDRCRDFSDLGRGLRRDRV